MVMPLANPSVQGTLRDKASRSAPDRERSASTATAQKTPMGAPRFPCTLTYLTPGFDAWLETACSGLDKENKLGEGIFRRPN